MAQSVHIDFNTWSQFDYHPYNIMSQDFVHDNLYKVNAHILTQKGRTRFQETIGQKEGNLSLSEQINIWFPLINNKSLYIQIKNMNFRLHFDNGLFTKKRMQHNIYSSIESNRNFHDLLYKIGWQMISEKWRCNFRYRYSTRDEGHTLYAKWRYDYNNWTFEGVKAFNLNKLILLKGKFLIGYYFSNKTVHMRFENQDWRTSPTNFKSLLLKDYFDHAIFNFTTNLDANTRLGFQAIIKSTGHCKPFSFVWQTYDPFYHTTLKLKANTDMSAAISIRNKICSYGSYVLGLGLKDIGKLNRISFGVQLDLYL